MPRGGSRPGAGAPKGNFNGVTSGNRSQRLRMVYMALLAWPDRRELGQISYRAGVVDRTGRFNKKRDLQAAVTFFYHYFFIDREEAFATKSLKANLAARENLQNTAKILDRSRKGE